MGHRGLGLPLGRAGQLPTGEELRKRDDVIEAALESALEQSAEIVVVRHHPDLEPLGLDRRRPALLTLAPSAGRSPRARARGAARRRSRRRRRAWCALFGGIVSSRP